jgi:hypothetical protein
MTVTTAQFEAMPRQAYLAVRGKMQTGDILLFHSTDLMSEGIEFWTDSEWSHASILLHLEEIDRVLIMECVNGAGVRMMPLSTRINGDPQAPKAYNGKLLLARHKAFPAGDVAKMRALTDVALERLGYPYSYGELVKISERICAHLVGRTLPGELSENAKFICSEFVAACYQTLGLTILPDKEGFMAPADIASDPNVVGVYSIGPDAPAR